MKKLKINRKILIIFGAVLLALGIGLFFSRSFIIKHFLNKKIEEKTVEEKLEILTKESDQFIEEGRVEEALFKLNIAYNLNKNIKEINDKLIELNKFYEIIKIRDELSSDAINAYIKGDKKLALYNFKKLHVYTPYDETISSIIEILEIENAE
jgi:hypothetical protein